MRTPLLILSFLLLSVSALAAWVVQPFKPEPEPAALAALFPVGPEFDFDPPAPGSYPLHAIKTAPDGTVLDVQGQERQLSKILDGKITLVSFVYLMCGDTDGCPLAMSTLFEIHDASIAAPILNENVQLLTISFDPERDTVAAIDSFAYPITHADSADRKIPWEVLTTSGQTALQPIIDGFGQVVDRSDDQETLNHLLRMYLVDRNGVIRNVYGLGLIDPRLLMTDVETLLMEEGRL